MTDELIEIAARLLFEHDCLSGEPSWVQLADHERESYRAALRAPAAAIEARVRAELAGQIAEALDAEAMKLIAAQSPRMASCYYAAATLARSFAAGSSPDTTPEG